MTWFSKRLGKDGRSEKHAVAGYPETGCRIFWKFIAIAAVELAVATTCRFPVDACSFCWGVIGSWRHFLRKEYAQVTPHCGHRQCQHRFDDIQRYISTAGGNYFWDAVRPGVWWQGREPGSGCAAVWRGCCDDRQGWQRPFRRSHGEKFRGVWNRYGACWNCGWRIERSCANLC